VILLPGTDVAAAMETAERVRAAIAEISLPGSDVAVTVSIGIGGFPEHASTLERLERLADAALYLAKRHGRNRVELAEPAAADTEPSATPASGSGPVPVPRPAPSGVGGS
jgi:diguanylate cyclase (GGDEF)-like protein